MSERKIDQIEIATTWEDIARYEIDALYIQTEELFNRWGKIAGGFDAFLRNIVAGIEEDIPVSMVEGRVSPAKAIAIEGYPAEGRDAQIMGQISKSVATLLSEVFQRGNLGRIVGDIDTDHEADQTTLYFSLYLSPNTTEQ